MNIIFYLIIIITDFNFCGCQGNNPYIVLPKNAPDQPSSMRRQKDPCDNFSTCTLLSECPLIKDLLDQSCFSSDRYFQRLNALTCGYSNHEDMVCCPPGGDKELILDLDKMDGRKPYSNLNNKESCGESLIKGSDYRGLGKHPWVARIGFIHQNSGRIRFACGGSIIHKRVVLTAAHCALAKPEGYFRATVAIGEWDSEGKVDCNDFFCLPPVQNIAIDMVVEHPDYQENIFRADIALIFLKDDIKFGVGAQPICLNASPEDLTGKKAELVGWGKLSTQVGPVSIQQSLRIPILPKWQCSSVFKDLMRGEEQLCAAGEAGEDACAGFGGSPLVIEINYKWVQIGILSFGAEDCGADLVPSVYTNLSHYYNWIKMTLQLCLSNNSSPHCDTKYK